MHHHELTALVLAAACLFSCASDRVAQESRQTVCHRPLPDGTTNIPIRFPPVYPEAAIRSGTTGFVRLNLDIDPYGRTQEIIVENAQPPGIFDAAAISAVEQWRYCPASSGTQNISVTLKFELAS